MAKDQEEIDFGWNNYLKELESDLSFVDVGILSKDGSKKRGPTAEGKQSDITMAELATIQEFGTVISVTSKMRGYLSANGLPLKKDTTQITIPSRPFMRQTFDEQEKELSRLADRLEGEILTDGKTKRAALSELGQTHKQQIQKNMATKGKFQENHSFTKERKGSSTPLVDTGKLRQSIDFEVG